MDAEDEDGELSDSAKVMEMVKKAAMYESLLKHGTQKAVMEAAVKLSKAALDAKYATVDVTRAVFYETFFFALVTSFEYVLHHVQTFLSNG